MKSRHTIWLGLVALLFIAFMGLQAWLLYRDFEARKGRILEEVEEISSRFFRQQEEARVDSVNAAFREDVLSEKYVLVRLDTTEKGEGQLRLLAPDAKTIFVEIRLPENPDWKEMGAIDLLMERNRRMLLQGSLMYWQDTLAERLRRGINAPWSIAALEAALNQDVQQLFPALEVQLADSSAHAVVLEQRGKALEKQRIGAFKGQQTFYPILSGLDRAAIRQLLPSLLLSLLLLIALGAVWLLWRMQEQKKQAWLQEREALLQQLAHTLMTPLSVASLALQRLQKKVVLPAAALRYVALADEELGRMRHLGESLLLLKEQEERLELRAFLAQLPTWAPSDLQLQIQPPEAPIHLAISEKRMTLVVYVLVDNARKYAGEAAQLQIWVEAEAQSCCIHVQDNGPGIPLKEKEAIFRPYFRGVLAQEGQKAGFGLGLYQAQQLLEAVGGQLKLVASPRESFGAHFQVSLKRIDA
ncbi:MAG: sensor histidine kinase [Nitritalea sp.]